MTSPGPVGEPHPAAHYGRATTHPRARITRRELEHLRLAANGNTNEHIARFLGITKDSVNGTLRRLYLKLGAKDRANAVAIALVRGVLKPSDIACVRDPGGTASVYANSA
ncbi:LuxR C-terminal-related transcriptional regulator [Streptomyces sp. NPDC059679]|uniref:LuxR C-terminal-related transcriptional regulator n=1 Tax=Streptomyces sp. NPDC059679 TaxID=3346903 RepID=UPI0036A6E490